MFKLFDFEISFLFSSFSFSKFSFMFKPIESKFLFKISFSFTIYINLFFNLEKIFFESKLLIVFLNIESLKLFIE